MSAPESAKILETTVAPDADGSVVRLQIADVPLGHEFGTIELTVAVRLPAYSSPLLAHLQREAIQKAQDALKGLSEGLYHAMDTDHYPSRPQIKKS